LRCAPACFLYIRQLIIALNFTLTPLGYSLAVRDAVSKPSGIGGALKVSGTMRAIEVVRMDVHRELTQQRRNHNPQRNNAGGNTWKLWKN
jgi:hypothetical protein